MESVTSGAATAMEGIERFTLLLMRRLGQPLEAGPVVNHGGGKRSSRTLLVY